MKGVRKGARKGVRILHKLQLPQDDGDFDANADRKRRIRDAATILLDYDAADDTAKRGLFSKVAKDLERFRYVPDADLRMRFYGHNFIKADPLYSGWLRDLSNNQRLQIL